MEANTILLNSTENTLLIIRRNDLVEFAKTIATKVIEEQPEPGPEEPEPLTPKEAERLLGRSRQTFYNWRKKGLIKGHVLGGRVYYFKSELLAAMK